jgi:hypothetical protein
MKTWIKISFLFILLVSCSNEKSPVTSPAVEILSTETPSPQVMQQNEIEAIWENSSHARAAEPVNCESCHETRDGIVLGNIEVLDPPTGQVSAGPSGAGLCGQCHEETLGENAHPGFTCTGCHDPHSTAASCTDSGCHSTIQQDVVYKVPPTPTDGHPKTGASFCGGANCHAAATAVASSAFSIHSSSHARVSCVACHTASGLQTGPSPDGSTWVLLQEVKNTDGEIALEPAFSHDLQLEVDCTTCHFENNLWGLDPVSGEEFGR